MSSLGEDVLIVVQQLGLDLNDEALTALCSMDQTYVFEFLDTLHAKLARGNVRNASNYVCATIARGYVPVAQGGGAAFGNGLSPSQQPGNLRSLGNAAGNLTQLDEFSAGAAHFPETAMGLGEDADAMEWVLDELSASEGMARAQEVGLELTEVAMQKLLTLPVQHASELLESVSAKHGRLRDPSNYICATIAKGYNKFQQTESGQAQHLAASQDFAASLNDLVATAEIVQQAQDDVEEAEPEYAGSVHPGTTRQILVPDDVTPLEMKVLELSAEDHFEGQVLDAVTLIALRSVPDFEALTLLSSLEAKGAGKGRFGISNINNYIQAAVAKMRRAAAEGLVGAAPRVSLPQPGDLKGAKGGAGGKGGMNYTGNRSQARAAELGLSLNSEAMEGLKRVSLQKAMALLDRAHQAQATGLDPSDYILVEVEAAAASAEEEYGSRKRARWGEA